MTVLGLENIQRKDTAIYYRRHFSAEALYDLPSRKSSGKIEFTIETDPFGKVIVTVSLIDPVDYPVIQVKRALKEYIAKLDKDGKLPL